MIRVLVEGKERKEKSQHFFQISLLPYPLVYSQLHFGGFEYLCEKKLDHTHSKPIVGVPIYLICLKSIYSLQSQLEQLQELLLSHLLDLQIYPPLKVQPMVLIGINKEVSLYSSDTAPIYITNSTYIILQR